MRKLKRLNKYIIASVFVVTVGASVMVVNHNNRNTYWQNILNTRQEMTNIIVNADQERYLIDNKILSQEDIEKLENYKLVRESVDLQKLQSNLVELKDFNNTIVNKTNNATKSTVDKANNVLKGIKTEVKSEVASKTAVDTELKTVKFDNLTLVDAINFNKLANKDLNDANKVKKTVDTRVDKEKAESQVATGGGTTYNGGTTRNGGKTTSNGGSSLAGKSCNGPIPNVKWTYDSKGNCTANAYEVPNTYTGPAQDDKTACYYQGTLYGGSYCENGVYVGKYW